MFTQTLIAKHENQLSYVCTSWSDSYVWRLIRLEGLYWRTLHLRPRTVSQIGWEGSNSCFPKFLPHIRALNYWEYHFHQRRGIARSNFLLKEEWKFIVTFCCYSTMPKPIFLVYRLLSENDISLISILKIMSLLSFWGWRVIRVSGHWLLNGSVD